MGWGERTDAVRHPPIVRPKPIRRKADAGRRQAEFLDSAKSQGHLRQIPAGSPDNQKQDSEKQDNQKQEDQKQEE
jgi:hypothetical protein